MTLGLVILAAALQWYQVLKISNFSETYKRENLNVGYTVFQFIRHDLQSSGYRGCRTQDKNFPIHRHFEEKGIPFQFLKMDRHVFGFEVAVGTCQHHLPQSFCNRIKNSSDVLIVYNIPQKIIPLKTDMRHMDDPLFVEKGAHISENSMVLISDAQQSDVFITNDVQNEKLFHQAGKNRTAQLSKCYKTDAEVTELQTIAYYLGIPDRPTAHLGTYSLFRSNILQKAEEIVENVLLFSVEYGFFDPVKGIQYEKASQIKTEQWPLVCLVRLKIETKNAGYHENTQKNLHWEFTFAIRNGHRIRFGNDTT